MTASPGMLPVLAAGARVRLRRKRREDLLDDYHWRRDIETSRYDASEPLTIPFSDYLRHAEAELDSSNPARGAFAIESAEGEHIGNVMFYNGDHLGQRAEFGISIGVPALRGLGLGTEAAILFLRFAWQELPFRTFYLHTLDWNERAITSFRRAGFEATANVYREGRWFLRMETRREWWLMWDMEGRFARPRGAAPGALPTAPAKTQA